MLDKVKNNRLIWIDAAKGFGILLVILGHISGIPEAVYKIIYSFHMPLFFIISVYLYNEEKYKRISVIKAIIIKARSYLLPYYIFAFINLIIQVLIKAVIYKNSVRSILLYSIDMIKGIILCCDTHTTTLPNCTTIWFLMCLFVASSLFICIIKNTNKIVSAILFLICMLISYSISFFLGINLPLKIDSALMASGFLYLGYIYRKTNLLNIIKNKNALFFSFLFLSLISLLLAVINVRVGMNENYYGNFILFLIPANILSILVLLLFKKYKVLSNSFFVLFGQISIFVVGFNFLIRDFSNIICRLISFLYDNSWVLLICDYTIQILLVLSIAIVYGKVKIILKNNHNINYLLAHSKLKLKQ